MARRICYAASMVAWAIVALIVVSAAGIGGGGDSIGRGTGLRPISEAVALTDRDYGDCFAPVDLPPLTIRLCREWSADMQDDGTFSRWVYVYTWTDMFGTAHQQTVPALHGPTEPMR